MNDKPAFFVLKQPRAGTAEDHVGGTSARPEEGFNVGEAPRCPNCGRFIGSLEWLPPFRVEIETWGQGFGDIVISTGMNVLVSGRFRDIYERFELRGLSGFEPVEIVKVSRHGKRRDDPPRYHRVSVIRSPTILDQKASGYEWSENHPVCPECLFPIEAVIKRWSKVVIQTDTWQGEDIFIPRGGGDIITSSRFKEVCEKNNVTNVVFYQAETYGHDYYPLEKQR
jgi:hypothetical protein